ncbi:MAG: ribosomal L7Ae/L30e/S12e/Gadd45 family protein [Bdellovibrionales bacterium]|nr:ribosomal L7Ae/L30e/S12e/Gadd45 family protein [Bdellovibrionales bacterium]
MAYKQAMRKAQKPEKAKKLIVSGIKECKRTMTTIIDKKRSKLLVVALNIERNPYQGGVDDEVQTVIDLAKKISIPIIHACKRAELGRAFTGKWGPRLTMVSIINHEGYQDMADDMLNLWEKACKRYNELP